MIYKLYLQPTLLTNDGKEYTSLKTRNKKLNELIQKRLKTDHIGIKKHIMPFINSSLTVKKVEFNGKCYIVTFSKNSELTKKEVEDLQYDFGDGAADGWMEGDIILLDKDDLTNKKYTPNKYQKEEVVALGLNYTNLINDKGTLYFIKN